MQSKEPVHFDCARKLAPLCMPRLYRPVLRSITSARTKHKHLSADEAFSGRIAPGAPRALRVEKQERVLGQVLERHIHDVPRPREPRMRVPDAPL